MQFRNHTISPVLVSGLALVVFIGALAAAYSVGKAQATPAPVAAAPSASPSGSPIPALFGYDSSPTGLRFEYPSSWHAWDDSTAQRTYLSNYPQSYNVSGYVPPDYQLVWFSIASLDLDPTGNNAKAFKAAESAADSANYSVAGYTITGPVTYARIGNADTYSFTCSTGPALVAYGTTSTGTKYAAGVDTQHGGDQTDEVITLKEILASTDAPAGS